MCMCSKSMNMCNLQPCGSNCVNFGPFRAVKPCPPSPPNTGTIIPFSSGATTMGLATLGNGLAGIPNLIGFGTAVPGVLIVGNTLDLSGIITEAFSVPRNGSITAISASFTALAANTIVGNAFVTAQVYRAPAGSTLFTATNARVTLTPSFTGLLTVGQTSFGSANIPPVPVAQGDRLVMVYTLSGTGITTIQTITAGTASAGITIS